MGYCVKRVRVARTPVVPPGIDIIGPTSRKVRGPGGIVPGIPSLSGAVVVFVFCAGFHPGPTLLIPAVLVINDHTKSHIYFDRQHCLPQPAVDTVEADLNALKASDYVGHGCFGRQFPSPVIGVPIGKVLQVLRIGFVSNKFTLVIIYFRFDAPGGGWCCDQFTRLHNIVRIYIVYPIVLSCSPYKVDKIDSFTTVQIEIPIHVIPGVIMGILYTDWGGPCTADRTILCGQIKGRGVINRIGFRGGSMCICHVWPWRIFRFRIIIDLVKTPPLGLPSHPRNPSGHYPGTLVVPWVIKNVTIRLALNLHQAIVFGSHQRPVHASRVVQHKHDVRGSRHHLSL